MRNLAYRALIALATMAAASSQLHAQVGDVLTGAALGCPLLEAGDDHLIAAQIGEYPCSIDGGGSVLLSVSRTDYVGLYKYRYLPEPADEDSAS